MKIGIIGAMEEELALLYSSLYTSACAKKSQTEYVTCQMDNMEIAMARCGIGKVNAAVTAALLLKEFKPQYLINIGVAGGFQQGINIGDIVVSSELRHYDADATIFSYERGQIPRMPASFKSDSWLLQIADMAGKKLNKRVHFGQVLSGDSFIHSDHQISDLQSSFPDALAVEMEGAAIAQTGYLFSTPFIGIRSVSDLVIKPNNSKKYKNSLVQAARGSCAMVLNMLSQIQGVHHEEN